MYDHKTYIQGCIIVTANLYVEDIPSLMAREIFNLFKLRTWKRKTVCQLDLCHTLLLHHQDIIVLMQEEIVSHL